MDKKLVLRKNSSKFVTSRNSKAFFGSMGDTYNGPKNFRNCKGVEDTFSKKSNTGENSRDTTHGPGTSSSNKDGEREHVEEGNLTGHRTSCWKFLSNIFLVGERDGGNRPVVNLRYLNQFIPYQHFKMEGLF